MPTVLLVRHGQASFGAADYDVLSPVGVRQAEVLAAALARRGVRPTRLICGNLRRQAETAAAFAAHGEPEVDERWDEFDANQILTHHSPTSLRLDGPGAKGQEGLTNRAFQAVIEPALESWVEAGSNSPSERTWAEFSGAGRSAVAELSVELGSGETAVIFTSGGPIAALCVSLLEASNAAFVLFNRVLVNTGVTKIAIGRGGTSLISINDHSHLEDEDRELITYR